MDIAQFSATDRDLELIDKVARLISPGAFDDRPHLKRDGDRYVVDEEFSRLAREGNERNRDQVRDLAITIIRAVQEHIAQKPE